MTKFVLSIDQGTTGTTAMLVDTKGRVVAKSDKDFKQIYPKPGWVEHDTNDIWKTVLFVIDSVLKKAKVNKHQILCVGITNQRETVVAWDEKTGEALSNAIVWQCRRTSLRCLELKDLGKESFIKNETGLVLDPYFSGSKMEWLIKNNSKVSKAKDKGTLRFGTMDAFLIHKLTGGLSHATDVTNASRTMLMSLKKLDYNNELLNIFGLSTEMLPQIKSSSGHFGVTKGIKFLLDGTPIAGVLGDQQSALLAQACLRAGDLKITFGTGSFLLFNTEETIKISNKGLLTTVAWQFKDEKPSYAFEGGAFICGAAVQWLRDEMKFIKKSSDVEKLAKSVKDSGGVQIVPAFVGMGAPHWDAEARGIISGLTRGTTPAHFARATLEAMALQNADIIDAMSSESQVRPLQIKVDGGATENNLLMQMQSDFTGVELIKPKNVETTAFGAAFIAGHGVGVWKKEDILKLNPKSKIFKPKMSLIEREQKLKSWNLSVRRAMLK